MELKCLRLTSVTVCFAESQTKDYSDTKHNNWQSNTGTNAMYATQPVARNCNPSQGATANHGDDSKNKMNTLLNNIANKASEDLRDLIESGEKDILKAIHKMEEEAQLQETNPKFALGFKITVDLNKSTFDCDLSWSIKQTLSVSHQMDDPNQGNLPIESTN